MFNRSTALLLAVTLALFVLPGSPATAFGVTSSRAMPVLVSASATPRALDAFFAAAALPPANFGGLVRVQEGPLSLDQVIAGGGPGAVDVLSGLGFDGAYGQGYRAASPVAILTGRPAGVGTLIEVFTSSDDAAAWLAFESSNADAIGAEIAEGQAGSLTVTGFSSIDLDLPGDQAMAFDLQGSASVQGIALPVHVAIGFMQRGPVVSMVVVAATQDQRAAMQALAQALDANVSAALPLLIT